MSSQKNKLFPVFLKTHQLRVLLIGGGNVALEKLHALLSNSPFTQITLISPEIKNEISLLAKEYNISIIQRVFEIADLNSCELVLVAINNKTVSASIHREAKKRKILTNVADTPELCDFYLSSIVQKGNLKIAISTNGQSPTMAKRLKELLNETLPDELDELIEKLHAIRNQLSGDFQHKVKTLNKITETLLIERIPS